MKRRGSSLLETVLLLPVVALLLWGMVELARIAYTYYTIQKLLYTIAGNLSTAQAVNYCDDADQNLVAAKNYALTGTIDGSGASPVPALTADMIEVSPRKLDAATGELAACACAVTGCDAAVGGAGPDYLLVSIPGGYQVQPHIPFMKVDPILLKPRVLTPYGGS
jgi:Flp pilus assembly protein TadG